MESKAKFLGHPLHQMLIVFPLGLLATSLVFDITHLISRDLLWLNISFWMIAGGVVGGLVAAIFGVIDWWAIPRGTRAWVIGLWHGVSNVIVMLLFAASWMVRLDSVGDDWYFRQAPSALPFVLSFAGGGLAMVAGWLGGELVDRLGVGVDPGAHLNSPSSLSGRPAAEQARDYER